MAMSYNTLVAPKGTTGSIADWTGYGKLNVQADTILTEAQSLINQALRVREMRTEWVYGLAAGQSAIALPARFLDPIGRLRNVTDGMWLGHKIEGSIEELRTYDNVLAGSFGTNPFTTTPGLTTIIVVKPAHGINQGSTITIAGVTDTPFVTLNATFPVTQVVDANTFLIDIDFVNALTAPVTGGGSGATYTANNLIASSPARWAIWNEQVQFDCATDTAKSFKQLYYRAPLPLSVANQTNFLTNRYPLILRKASQAATADFMKDDNEYTKATSALASLIQATNAESDLMYRGAEIDTETP